MSAPLKINVPKTLPPEDGEAGFSLIETLPLIMVMSALIGFLLGLWGMVHKNILASIASRNYAFETFNNRSNLIYFNDVRTIGTNANSYELSNVRFHGYGESVSGGIGAFTTPYRFPAEETVNEPPELHRNRIWNQTLLPDGGEGQDSAGTKSPWVLIGYGICLNSNCGEG
jgi:hypothetical protein